MELIQGPQRHFQLATSPIVGETGAPDIAMPGIWQDVAPLVLVLGGMVGSVASPVLGWVGSRGKEVRS